MEAMTAEYYGHWALQLEESDRFQHSLSISVLTTDVVRGVVNSSNQRHDMTSACS